MWCDKFLFYRELFYWESVLEPYLRFVWFYSGWQLTCESFVLILSYTSSLLVTRLNFVLSSGSGERWFGLIMRINNFSTHVFVDLYNRMFKVIFQIINILTDNNYLSTLSYTFLSKNSTNAEIHSSIPTYIRNITKSLSITKKNIFLPFVLIIVDRILF